MSSKIDKKINAQDANGNENTPDMPVKENSWKAFWKEVGDYIKEHWLDWLTLGLSLLTKKLKDWNKRKKEANKPIEEPQK